jgi:hypothetical protein
LEVDEGLVGDDLDVSRDEIIVVFDVFSDGGVFGEYVGGDLPVGLHTGHVCGI